MEAVTTTTSTLIMSSPTVVTPTRSHAAGHHPHHGYAGTDDDQGTDPPLDAERLTLMSGSRPQPSARHHRRQIKLSLYRSPRRGTRLSESTMRSRFHACLLSGGVTLHQGEVVGLHVFDRLAVARDDVGQTTHARGDVVADRGQSRVRLGGDGAVVEADQTEVCGDVLADDVSGTERCGG